MFLSDNPVDFNFNPRSHEGSDVYGKNRFFVKKDFNPRSHEGSDRSNCEPVIDLLISIHAPTRGATVLCFCVVVELDISIHAPTRGATKDVHRLQCLCYISIHAPTRGATLFIMYVATPERNFNPRSHEGSDPSACRSGS